MAIEFVCPHCDKLLRTADDKAGARAACPHCQGTIEIPLRSELADAAEVGDDPLGDFFGGAPSRTPAARALQPTSRCPACQAEISTRAPVCTYCGASIEAPSRPAPVKLLPHRGGLILALAICGWVTFVCFPLAISAAILGTQDLKAMHAGRMDPSGETMTQVGQLMGIVQAIVVALGIFVVIVLALVA